MSWCSASDSLQKESWRLRNRSQSKVTQMLDEMIESVHYGLFCVKSKSLSSELGSVWLLLWHFQCLLGWLTVSSSTGHLQLTDSEAAVDVVITMTSPAQHHQCSTSCDCSFVSPGERLGCPFIHPCCLGHLIIVKKYTVVVETFCIEGELCDGNSNKRSKNLVYLLFSAEDCVLVQKKEPHSKVHLTKRTRSSSSDSKEGSTLCRKHVAEKRELKQLPETSDTLVYITNKHYLCAHDMPNQKQSQLQFCAKGFMVTPKGGCTENKCISSTDNNGDVPQREASPAKKAQLCKSSSLDSSCGSGKENTSACSSKNRAHSSGACSESLQSHSCALSHTFQLGQPLSLTFEDRHCCWFDAVHPPGLYRFGSKEDSAALQWSQVDRRLQQAMARAGTPTAVKVSPAAFVDRMLDGCISVGTCSDCWILFSLPFQKSLFEWIKNSTSENRYIYIYTFFPSFISLDYIFLYNINLQYIF